MLRVKLLLIGPSNCDSPGCRAMPNFPMQMFRSNRTTTSGCPTINGTTEHSPTSNEKVDNVLMSAQQVTDKHLVAVKRRVGFVSGVAELPFRGRKELAYQGIQNLMSTLRAR